MCRLQNYLPTYVRKLEATYLYYILFIQRLQIYSRRAPSKEKSCLRKLEATYVWRRYFGTKRHRWGLEGGYLEGPNPPDFGRNRTKILFFKRPFISTRPPTPLISDLPKAMLFIQRLQNKNTFRTTFSLRTTLSKTKNCILLTKLFWPTVLVIEKTFEICGWCPRICKFFEITRTICSNSERSEQFLVT